MIVPRAWSRPIAVERRFVSIDPRPALWEQGGCYILVGGCRIVEDGLLEPFVVRSVAGDSGAYNSFVARSI